jgi:hypothetical protein
VELREPWSDRVRRVALAAIALIAVAVAATLYLRVSEARGAPTCARAYAEARTAADTALIDTQKADPEPGRVEAAYRVTCGELRQRGRLH